MFEVVKDLTSFAEVVWEQGEDILVDNVEGVVGKPDSTDSRVPGRILGCQEVYEQGGAYPYKICLSEIEKGLAFKMRHHKSVLTLRFGVSFSA